MRPAPGIFSFAGKPQDRFASRKPVLVWPKTAPERLDRNIRTEPKYAILIILFRIKK